MVSRSVERLVTSYPQTWRRVRWTQAPPTFLVLLFQVEIPAHGMALIVKLSLPFSFKVLWDDSHRHTPKFVSNVILKPVNLIMKIDHHNPTSSCAVQNSLGPSSARNNTQIPFFWLVPNPVVSVSIFKNMLRGSIPTTFNSLLLS